MLRCETADLLAKAATLRPMPVPIASTYLFICSARTHLHVMLWHKASLRTFVSIFTQLPIECKYCACYLGQSLTVNMLCKILSVASWCTNALVYIQPILPCPAKTRLQALATICINLIICFFGLQDICPFLSSKRAFRTPDKPEVRRNNGLMCMQ